MPVNDLGKVFLVGAGPGNPMLLTKKAEYLIRTADIIFYDRLVNPVILQLADPLTEIVDVGKKPYHKHINQEEINEKIIFAAKHHQRVVRLKGGDPSIFGRVQEETHALFKQNIAFEIVPGITTASAAVASLGVGLTARNIAKSVIFTTGSYCNDQTQMFDLKSLMDGGTLAIYMGMKKLSNILDYIYTETKIDYPVAILKHVSLDNEQVISGKLSTIAKKMNEQQWHQPGILLIGELLDEQYIRCENIKDNSTKTYLIKGPRNKAIEKVFELCETGNNCLLQPDSNITYHKSQLMLYEQLQDQWAFDAVIELGKSYSKNPI
ncbi:uroporphyrinogen-III C-methyltransferase [Staphylococcus sp. GSSP0090]|nr:uroporphyrinogen-III C-methyltransferase [Staphylococcus sp. GSSP0090]